MNARKKQTAVEKYKNYQGADLYEVMIKAGYKDDECAEIIAEIYQGTEKMEQKPANQNIEQEEIIPGKAPDAKVENETAKFDMNNLTGQDYQDYIQAELAFPAWKMAKYIRVMAAPVYEMQFDRNLNKVKVITGFKIVRKDMGETLITPIHARDLNNQLYSAGSEGVPYYIAKDLVY